MEKRYRLNIFKSNRYISAQVLDSENNSIPLKKGGSGIMRTNDVSKYANEFAKQLIDNKISKLYYDNKYRYHGKVKKFIEILRENKINI